jgi:hypothetical protein
LAWLGELHQFVGGHIQLIGGIVGMGANRTEHARVALGQRQQRIELCGPGSRSSPSADAGCMGTFDQIIALRIEIGEIEMAMGVDQHPPHASSGAT